jgi:hypothetical protein
MATNAPQRILDVAPIRRGGDALRRKSIERALTASGIQRARRIFQSGFISAVKAVCSRDLSHAASIC